MYNPIQNDNYNEWIELYNPTNQSINITGWTISDNYAEDFLEADLVNGNGTTIIPPYGFAVIADQGTEIYKNYVIPNETIKLCVDDKSIGNGLGNNGDKLILKNNLNITIDTVEYGIDYADIPGIPAEILDEGCSLSRHNYVDSNDTKDDFYEGIIPTPGSINRFIQTGETEIETMEDSFLIRRNEEKNIPLFVKNTGKYVDNITLKIVGFSPGWHASFSEEEILLKPGETKKVILKIIQFDEYCSLQGEIKIKALSEKIYSVSGEITLDFELLGPDLCIREIKFYNENKINSSVFGQGEIIRIKAFFKNLGNENATGTGVCFYYDRLDSDHLIGCKNYDSIGRYQKYPSVLWDTQDIKPGVHRVFVYADPDDCVDETREDNNVLSFQVNVLDTFPNSTGRSIVFSEVYYHSHPGLYNEYIKIYNPSAESLDLSGWYITNQPWKSKTDQNRIVFPNGSLIPSGSYLRISENASSLYWETGENPDFEYNVDSNLSIPQMNKSKKFIMSNNGGMIALKDCFNHTVDVVCYGYLNYTVKEWNDSFIPCVGEGVILRRNIGFDDLPFDTNTSLDWVNPRITSIGQSDLEYCKKSYNGVVKTFVSPDCSYSCVVKELRNAKKCIYLNVYEFTNGFLCDELINALLRNVTVNLYLEGSPVGGITDEEKFILRRVHNYGGNIRFISGDRSNHVYRRYSFNHAKYLVIDNMTVIVESCNWAGTGIPRDPSFGNREWGVIIRNEEVAGYFLNVFLDDWDMNRCDTYCFDDMNLVFHQDYTLEEKTCFGIYEPQFESETYTGNFTIVPIFSPDTSQRAIIDMIDSAKDSIFVEQLYIYKNWADCVNPFVKQLVCKSEEGVDVKVILNFNPFYNDTNKKCNLTKNFLEKHGVEVKYVYTNWSVFTNVHNKGLIVDNKSVMISSINWNENSVVNNREAGVIIENPEIACFYADVFLYDWNLKEPVEVTCEDEITPIEENENTIYIVVLFTMTFIVIARDWRKRKWT
jgi:phosphatidylserine/phosphatidylglycerophosphate/cardiolipin synthase-like enzyme